MTELQVLKDNIRVLLKLEHGTDINIKDDWDLLWQLLINDEFDLMKNLIINGQNINIENDFGETALLWARLYGKIEMFELLKENIRKVT